jgi:hypothetical protein
MGSLAENTSGGSITYRSSKAAMRRLIEKFGPNNSGKFYHYDAGFTTDAHDRHSAGSTILRLWPTGSSVGIAPVDYDPAVLLKPFGPRLAADALPSRESPSSDPYETVIVTTTGPARSPSSAMAERWAKLNWSFVWDSPRLGYVIYTEKTNEEIVELLKERKAPPKLTVIEGGCSRFS